MNTISLITLVLLVVLFLFNLWQLLFLNKDKQTEDEVGLKRWRLGLFILALSSLCAFVYFTSAINSIGVQQTLTDGIDVWTQTDTSYKEAFAYLPLVVALYTTQWLMFFIQLIQGFNFLGLNRTQGTGRMKQLR